MLWIFDLDNTLIRPALVDSPSMQQCLESLESMKFARNELDSFPRIREDFITLSFNAFIQRYQISPREIHSVKQSLLALDIPRVYPPFEDIESVAALPGRKYLVTSGISELQRKKANSLPIKNSFHDILYDDPFEPSTDGKAGIFAKIALSEKIIPHEIIVVGDNPNSEISAGNALGMPTVQVLRPGITKSALASLHVSYLSELAKIQKNYPETFA